MHNRALNEIIIGYVLNIVLLIVAAYIYHLTTYRIGATTIGLCAVLSFACSYGCEAMLSMSDSSEFRGVPFYKATFCLNVGALAFPTVGYLISTIYLMNGV